MGPDSDSSRCILIACADVGNVRLEHWLLTENLAKHASNMSALERRVGPFERFNLSSRSMITNTTLTVTH